MKFTVILPSRLAPLDPNKPSGSWFIERSIDCVRKQSLFRKGHTLEVIVGVDAGQSGRAQGRIGAMARLVESDKASQAAALNAGIRAATGDYVAFLEDDDLWHPEFLEKALAALAHADFLSSTQLETRPDGHVLRINDFATPSGWVMPRSTLNHIGEFNESHRWHLDNEWLGRLGESGLRRLHMVEATAPISAPEIFASRVQLGFLLRFGGGKVSFMRHEQPWPLVMRTVHPNSGMAQIQQDPIKGGESKAEIEALTNRFNYLPW